MVAYNDNQPALFETEPNQYLAERYPTLFTGKHRGERLVKTVILTAIGGTFAIGAGIIALRTSTEGLLAGVAFGGFALALGVASLVNSYDASCEIGEHLDNLAKDSKKMQKRAKTAREADVIKEHDGAVAEAKIIREHHSKEGEAASEAVMRQFYAAVVKSGAVFGDGPAPTAPAANAADDQVPSAKGNTASTNGFHDDRKVPSPSILIDQE